MPMEVRARRHQGTVSGAFRRTADKLNLGVLKDGNVRRLVGAEFASVVGDFMVLAAMPFAVLSVGGTAGQVAIALAVQSAGIVVALPLGGVLGDRLDRRVLMVAADLLRLAGQAAVAALLLSGQAEVWQLFCAQAIHGIGTGFFMPAASGATPDAVPSGAVQPTNALRVVGRGVAGAVGPLLGAGAIALIGPGLAMAVDAGSFAISAALLLGLDLARRVPQPGKGFFAELRAGWTLFRGRQWLWSVTAQFVLVNAFVVAPFFVIGPLIADRSLGGADAWAAILFGFAVGDLLGGFVASAWRPSRPLRDATIVFLLWTVPLVLLAFRPPLGVLVGGAVFGGVAHSIFDVIWETTIQKHVPTTERSRISSLEQFASFAFVPFGFALGGWLIAAVGARVALLASAALLLAGSAAVLSLRSVRELKAAPPGAEAREGHPAGGIKSELGDSVMVKFGGTRA